MIQLDTLNGHDQKVITEFNKLSIHLSDTEMLYHILTRWADDQDIESITEYFYDVNDITLEDKVTGMFINQMTK